jgi:hypothetical protein
MQQRHMGPRHRKQEGIQQDCQADFRTAGREASSREWVTGRSETKEEPEM